MYRKHVESGLSPQEWRELRKQIIERDHYTCQRCLKKIRTLSRLTVHHIMSRADGGSNDWTNLITLCIKCHDYVELNYDELKTRTLIENSYEDPIAPAEVLKIESTHEESFPRPEWHKYVYGGVKRENRWTGRNSTST